MKKKIGSFFMKIGSFFIWSSLIAVAVLAVGGTGHVFGHPAFVTAITPKVIDLTPAKIAELKEDLVTRLMNCERGGYSEDDGLVTIDNNQADVAFWSFVVARNNGAALIGSIAVSVIFTVVSLPASVLGNEAAPIIPPAY